MPSASSPYDLVVIGGGSAGLTLGKLGAASGARVAIVEEGRLGGDCTWTGCVPSKALLAAAHRVQAIRTAHDLGLPPAQFEAPIDLSRVLARVHTVQQQIYDESDSPEVLRAAGCDVIPGRGRFSDGRTLAVDGPEGPRTLRGRFYCIATGSHPAIPAIPAIPGIDTVPYLTNETIFSLERLPESLLVIGGGPVGVELGQALQRLGSRVTIVEALPQLLPRDDPEVVAVLHAALRADGIDVRVGAEVLALAASGGGIVATVRGAEGTADAAFAAVLVATGRRPNVGGLGLEAAGVRYDAGGGIQVDRRMRTSNRRIFAAGDVTGWYPLTHAAAYQAGIVLRNTLFPLGARASADPVPWATFTDPEVAHTGLTEAQARARWGDRIRVHRQPFAATDRAITDGRTMGLIKLITHGPRDRIVGAHIVGPAAGELIHEFVIAMAHNINALSLAQTIHVYPTLHGTSQHVALASLDRWLAWKPLRTLLRAYRLLRRMLARA